MRTPVREGNIGSRPGIAPRACPGCNSVSEAAIQPTPERLGGTGFECILCASRWDEHEEFGRIFLRGLPSRPGFPGVEDLALRIGRLVLELHARKITSGRDWMLHSSWCSGQTGIVALTRPRERPRTDGQKPALGRPAYRETLLEILEASLR